MPKGWWAFCFIRSLTINLFWGRILNPAPALKEGEKMSIKPFSAILNSVGAQVPVGAGMLTQGQAWFVLPGSGSDTASGRRFDRALASLAGGGAATSGALAKVTANRNDVVYFMAESNTAADTTDYQSSTASGGALIWNKDLTHLIGVPGGSMFSPRSRIALLSSYATAANLFTLSANACRIENMAFFEGVAHAQPTGCMKVSGNRNYLRNCHIAGIGDDTNDIASAYSLYISGAENVFDRCVIGLDTIDRGSAANSEIYFAAGANRNYFKDCIIISRLQHSTNSPQVRVAGGAMGNPGPIAIFDNCMFVNCSTNYGFAQTYVFVFTAAPTAGIMVVRNSFANATNWGVAGNHLILQNSVSNAGYNEGLGYSS